MNALLVKLWVFKNFFFYKHVLPSLLFSTYAHNVPLEPFDRSLSHFVIMCNEILTCWLFITIGMFPVIMKNRHHLANWHVHMSGFKTLGVDGVYVN